MTKLPLTGLSILSGLLLFAAWPVSPFTLLIFVGFVPLLLVADHVTKRTPFFGHAFLACLVWNIGSTWWIWNSTDIGTIAAIIANSFFMSIPWWGYHIFRSRYGKRAGYLSLVTFWMCFEYIHLNWQLSWPWLTLGNVFAGHPDWVQWYEYTGAGGGTLLVLVSNLCLYELLIAIRSKTFGRIHFVQVGALVLCPLIAWLIAALHYSKPVVQHPSSNVVIVQPNIDPYGKFDAGNASADISRLIHLSEPSIDSATRLVIWPETAMSIKDWQEHVSSNGYYGGVFAMMNRHTNATLLSGIETQKFYGKDKATATAYKTPQGDYFDDFNAAVTINAVEPLRFYNKSRLVPGVESMPSFLMFLAPVFEKFGGTAGGYGRSEESAVFPIAGSGYVVAPIICYESIYGEYVGTYVKKGATLLTIITNDGWWGNTPGHKQHLQYARLRAIETRRWVARSANTGISAVIDADGNILDTRGWDTQAAIKYNIPALTGETFYVQHGDYLYHILSAFTVMLLLWHIILMSRKRFFQR